MPDLRSTIGFAFRARVTGAFALLGAGAIVVAALAGCRMNPDPFDAKPTRPIEDVQRDHTEELLAIPGVVGVYQGASDDGTPFLGVMVVEKTPEIERRVPKRLEGYEVKIDVTGVIRPLTPEK